MSLRCVKSEIELNIERNFKLIGRFDIQLYVIHLHHI